MKNWIRETFPNWFILFFKLYTISCVIMLGWIASTIFIPIQNYVSIPHHEPYSLLHISTGWAFLLIISCASSGWKAWRAGVVWLTIIAAFLCLSNVDYMMKRPEPGLGVEVMISVQLLIFIYILIPSIGCKKEQ